MTATYVTRVEGEATESIIARDMVRRAAFAAPVLIALCGAIWGMAGAISAAFSIALVCFNFLLSAFLITVTARISLALMMGAVLGGYLIRLALIFGAVLLVKDMWWVELMPLGLCLIITQLGLLLWEMKYVSASLAFPALKPTHRTK